jgi:hypothetical protein
MVCLEQSCSTAGVWGMSCLSRCWVSKARRMNCLSAAGTRCLASLGMADPSIRMEESNFALAICCAFVSCWRFPWDLIASIVGRVLKSIA